MLQRTIIQRCAYQLVLPRGIGCCSHSSISHRRCCLSAFILTQTQPCSCHRGTSGPWLDGWCLRGVLRSPGKAGYNGLKRDPITATYSALPTTRKWTVTAILGRHKSCMTRLQAYYALAKLLKVILHTILLGVWVQLDMLLKNPLALKVLFRSRGQLVTLQILWVIMSD